MRDRALVPEKALGQVGNLPQLLPVCSYCGRIRNGSDHWQWAEKEGAESQGPGLTHGVCPQCYEKIVEPELRLLGRR